MQLNTDKMIARVEGGVGYMVFNNPAKRNATSLEMWEAVGSIITSFAADPEVRVVVMSGAGGKSFVAGADISQFEEKRSNADAAEAYAKISGAAKASLDSLEKPLIAMIQGFCMGGGLGIAMKADMRIASDDSQFGIPAAKLGIAYGFDSLQALVNLVGPAYAKEILFTARRLDAEEALRIGLVNAVVSPDELESTVKRYTDMIAGNAPLSIRASKFTINQVTMDRKDRDPGKIEALGRACFDSEDYVEGRRAFMAKKTPVFTGR